MTDAIDTTKTYVFHDAEVKLTGRSADRPLTQTRRNKDKGPTVAQLFEITPVDPLNGSWKKWVRMTELFEIK